MTRVSVVPITAFMHCCNQLSVTIFLLFSCDKKRYLCLLLPQGKTHKFSIFLFRHKNEREEKCQELKENKQLSIDMHCSHRYYSWLHDECIGQRVCNGCLLCALVNEDCAQKKVTGSVPLKCILGPVPPQNTACVP